MPRIILALSFLTIMMGCATTARHDGLINTQTTPPLLKFQNRWSGASATDLEKLETGSREQNLYWWKNYHLAQLYTEKEPLKACDKYNLLVTENEFPLRELALLRSHQVCPTNKRTALSTAPSPWFRDLSLDIKLAENENVANLLEKARAEANLRKKEQLLLRALKLAQTGSKAETSDENVELVQKQLYRIAPRFIPQPDYKDFIAVAHNFRSSRDFTKAVEIYQQILKHPKNSSEEKFQALKGIRQTYKIMENKNDYVAATAELVNWTKKQFLANKKDSRIRMRFHDAQILLARTLWTEGQVSQAVKTLNETQRLLKSIYPLDEAYFIEGRIEEEQGRQERALEYYEAAYQEPVSLAGLRDKILWLKSWNYFKLLKYDQAITSFQQMKDKTKDNSDKARAAFWLARCYSLTGKKDLAKEQLQKLASEDPLGYYGLLAYREMKTAMPAIAFQDSDTLNLTMLSLGEVNPTTRLTVEWLISLEEKTFVEKMLNDVVSDLKKKNITREETWLTVTSTYARAGLYLPLFAAVGALPANVKDQLVASHPDLLFPLPYDELVKSASEKSGTPASFIYSIIRQESAFNPEARSPVDAMGLMQLLPSVAKNIAEANKGSNLIYNESEDLFDPNVNIPLGAFELKSLMDRYKGQFILATAAYNASGKAIRGWLNSRYRPDPVEFIEEIPYEETRSYIKLVMRNYAFYERLLNKNNPTDFPERLLSFSQPETKN